MEKELIAQIEFCRNAMGHNSKLIGVCSFCNEKRDTEGILNFNGVLAHYDCMPCCICEKSRQCRGVKKHGDFYYHSDCKDGRDLEQMDILDQQIKDQSDKLKNGMTADLQAQLDVLAKQRFGSNFDLFAKF